jgi:hypothetical protein
MGRERLIWLHAWRHLDPLREGLIQALGRHAGRNGLLHKATVHQQYIAAARDGGVGHCDKSNDEAGKDCLARERTSKAYLQSTSLADHRPLTPDNSQPA